MIDGLKVVVVMPAYNAARTIEAAYNDLPQNIVDDVIVVDDHSSDGTYNVARKLGIKHVIVHSENRGYGANQKTCYYKALEVGADIIIMVHPDYQYNPRLVSAMAAMISSKVYDCVLGSRILSGGALKGGMPIYKYIGNRLLTLFQNTLIPQKLSEYHTGFRGYSRQVLEGICIDKNSDDFLFDNQFLLQIIGRGYHLGEISCPTRYDSDSSTIGFRRSVKYALGVIYITVEYKFARLGLINSSVFNRLEDRTD